MVWGDIMTSFWPMCVLTSAIARFIPIFKLEYFWNAKTYTGEILIWCHIDGILSEKPQNTHNLNCLFFNGCLGWKFKNCWNDWEIDKESNIFLYMLQLRAVTIRNPLLFYRRYIYFGVFLRCDTCDVSEKFSCRNNPTHEHIFRSIFRQKCISLSVYYAFCIQYACKIV